MRQGRDGDVFLYEDERDQRANQKEEQEEQEELDIDKVTTKESVTNANVSKVKLKFHGIKS